MSNYNQYYFVQRWLDFPCSSSQAIRRLLMRVQKAVSHNCRKFIFLCLGVGGGGISCDVILQEKGRLILWRNTTRRSWGSILRQIRVTSYMGDPLRQAHTLFQSEFPRQCDLVLPLSLCRIFSSTQCHLGGAYVLFLVFPSLLFFPLSLSNLF